METSLSSYHHVSTELFEHQLFTDFLEDGGAQQNVEQHRFRLSSTVLMNWLATSCKTVLNNNGDDSSLVADGRDNREQNSEVEDDDNNKAEEEAEEEPHEEEQEEEGTEDEIEKNEDDKGNEENEETLYTFYAKFIDHFMPAVKGEKKWKRTRQDCCRNQNVEFDLNEHATISDEAFLLVCLENYSAVWEHQMKQKNNNIQETHEDSTDDTSKQEGEEVSYKEVLHLSLIHI